MSVFPPTGPTSVTALGMFSSYPYQEYADDDNIRAFFDAYNTMAQQYVDWFNTVNLPIYTGLSGSLLDWVAAGLYGMTRPSLPSGSSQNIGALNTWALNTISLNTTKIIGPASYYQTNDDVFKRILTWHLWRGDGRQFNIRWLKRRVMRFLTGTDGGPGQTDETYPVSVTFGTGGQVNINLQSIRRYATGGAMLNVSPLNTAYLNELDTASVSIPVSPFVAVFKAAMEAGVLEFPFQYSATVNL